MKICFATNNKNKLKEVSAMLGKAFELVSLTELGQFEDLEETSSTLEGNSMQKASFIHKKFKIPVFADDTGLEVEALGGEPGVKSARYAGPSRDNEENISLLLKNLKGKENKYAQFRTVITYLSDEVTKQFEGIVEGEIIEEKRGSKGFGYDPVFVPKGYESTFSEMDLTEKNKISHRGKAFSKLVEYLKVSMDK